MFAKFKVGQRVQVNSRCRTQRHLIGHRGTITGRLWLRWYTNEFWERKLGWRYKVYMDAEGHFTGEEKVLSPVYDGDQKISWEAMKGLWQPKEVTPE